MIAKIQLFFDMLTLPLSWMPDFCLKAIDRILIVSSVLIVLFLVIKIAQIAGKLALAGGG